MHLVCWLPCCCKLLKSLGSAIAQEQEVPNREPRHKWEGDKPAQARASAPRMLAIPVVPSCS